MQKVLRRTAQAERHAELRRAKRVRLETVRDRVLHRKQKVVYNREGNEAVREARKRQREDYALGPLAPWRENPMDAPGRGTWHPRRLQPPQLGKNDRREHWFIRQGDRVVVVKGRDAVVGRIGEVKEINENSDTVTVDGINIIEVRIPEWAGTKEKSQSIEEPIPYDHVRLVYPLEHPETGVLRDVIVKPEGLSRENVRWNQYKSKWEWNRVLQPQGVVLEWPEFEDPVNHDEVCDTLLLDVEQATFTPELMNQPMPPEVLDELRNKYSKLRTRHDDEWVEQKVLEDEQEERKKQWAELLTVKERPRTEQGERFRRMLYGIDRKHNPWPVSERGILKQLGAHMYAKRQLKKQSQEQVAEAATATTAAMSTTSITGVHP